MVAVHFTWHLLNSSTRHTRGLSFPFGASNSISYRHRFAHKLSTQCAQRKMAICIYKLTILALMLSVSCLQFSTFLLSSPKNPAKAIEKRQCRRISRRISRFRLCLSDERPKTAIVSWAGGGGRWSCKNKLLGWFVAEPNIFGSAKLAPRCSVFSEIKNCVTNINIYPFMRY